MMKEYGVGILGFGYMGKAHTYGYKTIPFYYNDLPFRTKLVGVCTAHKETAEQARDLHGFSFATTNPDEILTNKEIDIVHICTPNAYHREQVIKALKSGKHIYCDKPLVARYQEAEEILDFLDKTDVITQMTFQNRFLPAVMRAKILYRPGQTGENHILSGFLSSFRFCGPRQANWLEAGYGIRRRRGDFGSWLSCI